MSQSIASIFPPVASAVTDAPLPSSTPLPPAPLPSTLPLPPAPTTAPPRPQPIPTPVPTLPQPAPTSLPLVPPSQTPTASRPLPTPFHTPVLSTDQSGKVITITDIIQPTGASTASSSSASAISSGVLAAIITGSILGFILLLLLVFLYKSRSGRRRKDAFPAFFPSSSSIGLARESRYTAYNNGPLQQGHQDHLYSQEQLHLHHDNLLQLHHEQTMPMQVENGGLVGSIGGYDHIDADSAPAYYLTDGTGTATAYTADGRELHTVPFENQDAQGQFYGGQEQGQGHMGQGQGY